MEARVKKWGNSLGIRIPKSVVDEIGLHSEVVVDLLVKDGQLVIRPKTKTYKLEDLLDLVTLENIHPQTDWGSAVGKETW